jgi:feruloyl-CoA synthase
MFLPEPPSPDRGEITDKGSINQRAVLVRHAERVAELYSATPGAHIAEVRGG